MREGTSRFLHPRGHRLAPVTDWLQVCRDAAAVVGGVLEELPTRLEREPRVGDGEGGDETTAVDAAAEAAVVGVLEAVPDGFTLISEELGERAFGDGGDGLTVVCDPIDGSLNAKRGIPFFSLSLAVRLGPAHGRRRARLRPGLRKRRGVGCAARRGRVPEREPARRAGPEGADRDPVARGDADRSRRRARRRPGRLRRSHPRDGLAGALALPPRRRTHGRGRLAQAGSKRGHRRGPAARARARAWPSTCPRTHRSVRPRSISSRARASSPPRRPSSAPSSTGGSTAAGADYFDSSRARDWPAQPATRRP